MNVDDAMETAAAYLAAHEQEQEPLFDSEEVAITLAAEVERLRAELTQYKKSLPVCEKHKPDSGCRSGCMICGLEKQSSALSRIDYACGKPNVMQISLYDWDCDEERVVKAVQRLKAELAETKAENVGLDEGHDRLSAELAAAKAASELPVQVIDCYSFGDDVEVVCKCGDDADRLSGWIRERMKENSI